MRADVPATMMALKRAVAKGGPRRHRTIAKPAPRQRCPLPASSPRERRAPALRAVMVSLAAALRMIARAAVAGQARPEAGARRLYDLFVGMRKLLIGAAGRAIAWYVVFRRRGVHWRFHFSVQCLPKVTADCPRPFLSKEWLYDGGILDCMAMAFLDAAVQTTRRRSWRARRPSPSR